MTETPTEPDHQDDHENTLTWLIGVDGTQDGRGEETGSLEETIEFSASCADVESLRRGVFGRALPGMSEPQRPRSEDVVTPTILDTAV